MHDVFILCMAYMGKNKITSADFELLVSDIFGWLLSQNVTENF